MQQYKNHPKAVFFVRNFIVGGLEKVLVSAVNILVNHGWEISIVWSGYVEKNHLWEDISPKVKQIFVTKIWHLPLFAKPTNPLLKFFWYLISGILVYLNKYISPHIPDFDTYDYVIDFANGSSLVYRIPLHNKQKRIVWMHGAFSGFQSKKKFQRRKLFDYDKLVCLTEDFQSQFVQVYPQYKDKICHIYNPFNLTLPEIDEKEKLKAQQLQPFFLHVARIDTDKDIPTMIKAYAQFAYQTLSPTKLVFVGDGKQKDYFKKYVAKLGLTDKIIFNGLSSCPNAWMQQAKALILSSYKEGLPTVLIEGQIAKTLVVSCDCKEGPAEILKNGEAGLLFPVGDVERLAEILTDIDADTFDKEKYISLATDNLFRFGEAEFVKKFNALGKN